MTDAHALKIFHPVPGSSPIPGSSPDISQEISGHCSSDEVNDQLSQRLSQLNSQLVLYARDFRRMVDHQQRKADELEQVKTQLAQAHGRLEKLSEPEASPTLKLAGGDSGGAGGAGGTGGTGGSEGDLKEISGGRIVGESPALLKAMRLCQRVAPTQTTVLITGETGTGKELAARWIHQNSKRHDQAFIAINCGALPESLMESELFGHVRGAFTGADGDKVGLVELAAGGTLMLDEIGELPLRLQVKLLRVLEDQTYRRVGEGIEQQADIRILAATNRDLKAEVAAGHFRADLMYRLNIFPVHLPALRERITDMPLLVAHFLQQWYPDGQEVMELSPQAAACLMAYDWPGNVRELRNMLERAALLADDEMIEPEMFGEEIHQETPAEAIKTPLSKLAMQEKTMIVAALSQNKWNKAAAARTLGISWDNLRYRIKKYDLHKESTTGNR